MSTRHRNTLKSSQVVGISGVPSSYKEKWFKVVGIMINADLFNMNIGKRKSEGATNELPPRWLHCPRKGTIISGLKFLAFKTPLDSKFDENVPEECRFSPGMLVDGVDDLGLIIDLSKTDRFYDKTIFEDDGVEHVKIKCAGFGAVPNEEQVNRFISVCKIFWKKKPLKVIGVHCTHGFNRTGYMIISYLVREQSLSVEAAFQLFKESREPGIYKPDYIDELSHVYGDGSETMLSPELPSWCSEFDDGDPDEPSNEDSSGSRKRRRQDKEVGKFMEGVSESIQPVAAHILRELQQKCCTLSGKKGLGFVGSQPVSLDVTNISLLHQMPYNVSWKADGFRYLMLVSGENQVYMVDRDNNLFKIPAVKFLFSRDLQSHLSDSSNPLTHLTDTLIDGEMVLDKDGSHTIPRYLIYDIITLNGQFVGDQNHDVRLKIIQKELVDPRRLAISKNILDRQAEPFGIRKKDFWPLSANKIKWVLDTFMPTLAHENDGVILTPVMKAYTIGTTHELLKWKPGNMNSVDFLLHVEENKPRPGELKEKVGKLYVGGLDQPYAIIRATKKIRELHRRIVECVWKDNTWDVMRVREDKSFPNSYQTAQNVVESIRHPVTKDGLIHYVEKYGWKMPKVTTAPTAEITPQKAPLNGDQKLMPPPMMGPPPLRKKPSSA